MRRVIQRTITTTKIILVTITHSNEEVEYTLTSSVEELVQPEPPATVPGTPALTAGNEAPETSADQCNLPDKPLQLS